MRSLAQATPSIEANKRAGVDRDAELRAAFERLRGGGAPHPRAVGAGGPPHPRVVTPLGDKVPPRRAFDNLRSGPPSAFKQLRELSERHMREDADIRAALRRARAARRAPWRPPVARSCPSSTARPREGGARVVAVGGRDGDGTRDDGSGGGDGNGGGSDPPPPRLITVARRDRDREPLAGRRS
jgi:hypothetical protein